MEQLQRRAYQRNLRQKMVMDKLKSQFVFLLLGIWGKQKFKDTVDI